MDRGAHEAHCVEHHPPPPPAGEDRGGGGRGSAQNRRFGRIGGTPRPTLPRKRGRVFGSGGMSEEKRGWLQRLKAGLARSSTRLAEGIGAIVARRRLDDETLAQLEELLIAADMGVGIAAEIVGNLRRTRFNQEISAEEIKLAVAQEVARLLDPIAKPLRLDPALKPHVILVVGVNGSGKTTTIGKLAKQFRDDGKTVVLAAGDTFRAAAVEQLKIWGA